MERFVAYWTEVYKGAFPTWLARYKQQSFRSLSKPTATMPTKSKNACKRKGLRVEVDDRNEKMGYKIRASQTQKIPYQIVVGDKEVEMTQQSICKSLWQAKKLK